jgi:uncharacterized protein (TIGR03437 family)
LPATVQYAGSAPGYVYGATQVNLILPAGLASGLQPVLINVGGIPSQSGVTVQVK